MALHGICRSTWIAAAHGAPQPAGHRGRGVDRDLLDVRAVRAVDRSARPLLHRSAFTVDGAVVRALVWHGRVGPRHSVARDFRGTRFDAGGELRGGSVADAGADLRIDCRILWRLCGPLSERDRDERVYVVPWDTAGDCIRGVSRTGAVQPGAGALDWRMGGLCSIGARPSAGGEGAGIRRGGPRTGRERLADYRAAHPAKHYSTGHRAGGDWNGGSDPGGSDHELSRAGRAASDGDVGSNAQRRALVLVRRATPSTVPGRGSNVGGVVVQFHRRWAAGLP